MADHADSKNVATLREALKVYDAAPEYELAAHNAGTQRQLIWAIDAAQQDLENCWCDACQALALEITAKRLKAFAKKYHHDPVALSKDIVHAVLIHHLLGSRQYTFKLYSGANCIVERNAIFIEEKLFETLPKGYSNLLYSLIEGADWYDGFAQAYDVKGQGTTTFCMQDLLILYAVANKVSKNSEMILCEDDVYRYTRRLCFGYKRSVTMFYKTGEFMKFIWVTPKGEVSMEVSKEISSLLFDVICTNGH